MKPKDNVGKTSCRLTALIVFGVLCLSILKIADRRFQAEASRRSATFMSLDHRIRSYIQNSGNTPESLFELIDSSQQELLLEPFSGFLFYQKVSSHHWRMSETSPRRVSIFSCDSLRASESELPHWVKSGKPVSR